MINESDSENELHSKTLELFVDGFPEGENKQSAKILLDFVAKLRLLVCKPDNKDEYAHWFGQVRECLSGRDCDEAMVKRLGRVVEQFGVPHQFIFDFVKGIESESQVTSFRDFAALETCAYSNSSAILICLVHVLGNYKPDESAREALIELGIADYLLCKMSDFLPQMESKLYFLADQEVQDRGLDLLDLTEPVDDGLWKDLIQFQCQRLLEKLQSVKVLNQLPGGQLKRALNRLVVFDLTLLKKIRRMPSVNLRARIDVTWTDRLRASLRHWRFFQVPPN